MSKKHVCEACRERKARFQYRGVVKADRAHTLCFACFRSERDRLRARVLAASVDDGMVVGGLVVGEQDVRPARVVPNAGVPAAGAPAAGVMTPGQRAHRFRMLAHMTRTRAQRSW
jgi:hypothetical protein